MGLRQTKRSRSIVVVALALTAAVAGTAIAGSGPEVNTSASAKKTAENALKKAKKAKKKAQKANKRAKGAQGSADAAQGSADTAQGSADAAQGSADRALARSVRMSFLAPENTAATEILSLGGLKVNASCDGSGLITIEATTTADDSRIHVSVIKDGGNGAYAEDDFFDSDSPAVPLAPDQGSAEASHGSLTYRNGANGKVVTVTYLLEQEPPGVLPPIVCEASGNATVLPDA